ncbi:MAG: PrsW family intramembrane metalloprotease [Actinomycetes bacterium]
MTSSAPEPQTTPEPFRPPVPDRPVRPRKPVLARWAVRVAVVLLFAVSGVLTVLAISTATGLRGLVVGLVLAVLPVVPVVAAFLWLDRYETEPPALLLFAFGWGAAVATLVSLVVNTASMEAIAATGGDPSATAVLVAPVVEETAKGLAVLAIFLARRREFDGIVDGIVYAGLVGIGFAFVENVLYLGRAFLEGGSAGAAAVFVVRAMFSPFAHPLFTMAIGIGIGLAARRHRARTWLWAPALGWVVAVLLHALWNVAAVASLSGFLLVYVVVQVPLFVAAVVLAVIARRREGRLVARHLAVYAHSGWLTTAEVRMMASLPERASARSWARRTLGHDAHDAMRDFQEVATELAFLRERMSHGTAPDDAADTEVRMLQTLWHLRSRFLPQRVA